MAPRFLRVFFCIYLRPGKPFLRPEDSSKWFLSVVVVYASSCLGVPVLRKTTRISQRYPYCALWGFWCLNMANLVRYPLPLFWAFPPWRACEVGVQYFRKRGISAILARYHMKTKQKGCDTPLCDTISTRYCATWGLSRTGPQSFSPD